MLFWNDRQIITICKLFLYDELGGDPISLGEIGLVEADLRPVTGFFEYIDLYRFFDRHDNVGITGRFVTDVDRGVNRYIDFE